MPQETIMRAILLILLIGMLQGCDRPGSAAEPTTTAVRESSSTQPAAPSPVAAIWYERSYPPPGVTEPQTLIAGIWSDGTVVWSKNLKTGGKPYVTAKIDPSQVEKLIRDLDAAGFFAIERQVNFGPDASYTVIAADGGDKRQWVGSWHDPRPANPSVVVTERGMSVVQPGQAPPEPSRQYAQFVQTWAKSRELIEAIIPPQGEEKEMIHDAVFGLGKSR
jgi:hypothetical protein